MDRRIQDISPGRQRMSVSGRTGELSFRNTQDWTGGLGISPSGRFRVIEDPKPRQPVISRAGIRTSAARWMLGFLAVFLATVLIGEMARLGSGQLAIQRLNTRIASVEEKNEGLRIQLAVSGGDMSVCTEAVKLNLISSSGARTIELTAPQGARMRLVENEPGPGLKALAEGIGDGQGD